MTITIFTLWISIILLYCAMATWKLFEKAGRKSWEGLVPIYNIFIWLKIIKRPWWWAIILLIPGFSQILMFMSMNVSMGRMFGKFSVKDTLMQIFVPFIYFPMIAFSGEELVYEGETNWDNEKEIERRKLSDQIVLGLASFGIITILVIFQKITGSKDKKGQKSMVKEWGDSIVFALIAASLIRGYVLEAFTIPTPSMEKELLVGDFLFVNKLSYGTRVPMTPLSYPLVHNTIPFTYANSYSEAIKLPYYRLPGFGKVQRNDIVVFNHPVGDTAVFGRYPGAAGAGGEIQGHNYYELVRREAVGFYQSGRYRGKPFFENLEFYESLARKKILVDNQLYNFNINGHTHRPVDKKENYIKRCVAVGGDTLQIVDGQLYINGKENNVGENVNYKHVVKFNRPLGNIEYPKMKEMFGFNLMGYSDITSNQGTEGLPINQNPVVINMSKATLKDFQNAINNGAFGNLKIESIQQEVAKIDTTAGITNNKLSSYVSIYPNSEMYHWTVDNYGPLWMPKEGATIDLNPQNWAKYKRVISTYENNDVSEKNGTYFINGEEATSYTFKQDYYYMIGDNRHNSADSRSWGFVPEDHVVGKGLIIWMSKDQEKGWTDGGVRWNRIFKTL